MLDPHACEARPTAELWRAAGSSPPARQADVFACLQGLGPTCCIYPSTPDTASPIRTHAPWPALPELVGLAAATHFHIDVQVDPRGPAEWCWAIDRHGAARFGIALLPDSDYSAWDALVAAVLAGPAPARQPVAIRRRAVTPGYGWHAGAFRFRLQTRGMQPIIDMEEASLSRAGAHCLARLVRERGALLRGSQDADPAARRDHADVLPARATRA